MESRRPNLIRALNEMENFKMELKWDFQSWGKCLAQFESLNEKCLEFGHSSHFALFSII
jgi:hypothetical protein